MLKKKDFIPSFILSMFENGVCSLVGCYVGCNKTKFSGDEQSKKKKMK